MAQGCLHHSKQLSVDLIQYRAWGPHLMHMCEFFSSPQCTIVADRLPWRPGLHNGLYPTDAHHADDHSKHSNMRPTLDGRKNVLYLDQAELDDPPKLNSIGPGHLHPLTSKNQDLEYTHLPPLLLWVHSFLPF